MMQNKFLSGTILVKKKINGGQWNTLLTYITSYILYIIITLKMLLCF